MQLFHNPNISNKTKPFSFNKEESKHIVKVLRKKIGDKPDITNGMGWLFTSKIISADIKKCVVSIETKTLQPKKNYTLHLAVAPTKINDRYEWFLEKATEIGIDIITPICEHSERKIIKHQHFEKMLQSAMKQSLQCYLPKLNQAISFKEFIKQDFKGQRFIAHCEADSELVSETRKSLKQELHPIQDATILIGPEGDFYVKEIEMAIQNKFIPVTLGETRLRIETAAIVACHSVAFINET